MKRWVIATLLFAAPGIALAATRYIAFGDSITAGVGDDEARAEKGYPPRLQALLVQAGLDAVVENHGLGGEKTAEGVERVEQVLAGGGDVLLLMEGSNDISREISIESTRFNLREIARKAESRGLRVVHATVIPRIPQARVDPENLITQRLNQHVRDLAASRERDLADVFEIFWQLPNRFATHYWLAADDFVGHPNATGYDLIARVFADTLRDVDRVPPVVGVLDPFDGQRNVSAGKTLSVPLFDFGAGIDLAATSLLINGAPVSATLEGDASAARLVYAPPQPWSGIVQVGLRSRDLANPANTVDRRIVTFYTAGTVFLPGDVDRDGRVDGADLVKLGRAFGARTGTGRYVSSADFNADGVVDGADLAQLAANFGRSL